MSDATFTGTSDFPTRASALQAERNFAVLAAGPVSVPAPVPFPVPPVTPVYSNPSGAFVPASELPVQLSPVRVEPVDVSPMPVPPAPQATVEADTDAETLSALDHAVMSDEAFVVHNDPWADVTNESDGSINLEEPVSAPEDDVEPEDDDETRRRPNSARRAAAKERALVRRTAAKVLEVQSASPDLVAVAASIVGVNVENTVDLTVAIITANARDLQVVGDLKTILDADSLEAGVTATALGRVRLRGVWNLLAGLSGIAGPMPSSDPKAAIAVVRALHAGDSVAIRGRVDRAVALLRSK